MTWTETLVVINLITVICVPLAGYIGFRSAMAKTGQEIQDRVQKMMHDENELLQTRVKRLEAENRRQRQLLLLIIDMLKKKRRIELEIDNDIVTLRDTSGTHVARVQTKEEDQ